MTNVTEQEAVNQFTYVTDDANLTVNPVKIDLPTSIGENGIIFGEALPTWWFGNISGSGLPSNTILQTGQGLQLVPDESGNILEQRVCFNTIDFFFEDGTLQFEGFEYMSSL